MNFNKQDRKWSESDQVCHPERSEGSVSKGREILRCAQDDITDFGRESS